MRADFAYIGTRFIATQEANAVDKQMILDSAAADMVYTPFFSGRAWQLSEEERARSGRARPDQRQRP